ncbi:MAG: hypothetical protein J6T34_01840 [Bacilli bacterium]|nr:hypothetical protein [Bacilli bacterium]
MNLDFHDELQLQNCPVSKEGTKIARIIVINSAHILEIAAPGDLDANS